MVRRTAKKEFDMPNDIITLKTLARICICLCSGFLIAAIVWLGVVYNTPNPLP